MRRSDVSCRHRRLLGLRGSSSDPFPDQLPGIEWAISSSLPVFVSVDERGNEEYSVDVVAVGVETATDFIFLGDCAEEGIGEPLRSVHRSDDADSRVEFAKARGLTGRELGEFLRPERAQAPERGPSDRILNPEEVDEEVLAELQFAAVVVDVEGEPRPGETLCLKSDAGWGDCLDLSAIEPVYLEAFLEFKSGQLEVWLTDEQANLDDPVRRIGRVKVPNDIRRHAEVALHLSVDIDRNDVQLNHSANLLEADLSEAHWAPLN